ncbi:MAG: amidohydrolase family protein [Balneolaceae bacterium]
MRYYKLFTLFVFAFFSVSQSKAQIAVKGDIVYTSAGDPIENGVVLIKDGKIDRVGKQSDIRIPSNYEIMEAAVITPGLIDVHSVVGLAGHYNQRHDQDQLETSSAIQPELRAIDAYNAREELVGHLRSLGITTVHTGHGPGALISGQTMIVKTTGETVEESVIVPAKMLAFTMGSMINSAIRKPGTRSKGVSMLRQELIKAQDYAEKRKKGEGATNLGMEALADLLEGKLTALITVHKANDIMTAIRLQKEFGFPMVIDGAAEAYLILDEIKASGLPVFVHPTMTRTYGDTKNASFETAGKLHEAGIPFAFQSGFEGYVPKTRVVLFEAAVAAANGLDMNAALDAITIESARLLGIEEQVGSLERGKDADLVLFNGDPFEYTSQVTGVIINGEKQ